MKMITISNCASASTKPGHMSMLERRELRGVIAMRGRRVRSAPGVFRQSGDSAGDDADVAAQVLHALLTALDDVFAEPRDISFDVAQMVAEHVIVAERIFDRLGKSSEVRP